VRVLFGRNTSVARYWDENQGDSGRYVYHLFGHRLDENWQLNCPPLIAAYPEDASDCLVFRVVEVSGYFSLVDMRGFRYLPQGRAHFIGPFREGNARILYILGRNQPIPLTEMAQPDFERSLRAQKGRWSYLNPSGRTSFDSLNREYITYLGDFQDGSAIYRQKDRWGLLDSRGKPLLPAEYTNIEAPNAQSPYLIVRRSRPQHDLYSEKGHFLNTLQTLSDSSRKGKKDFLISQLGEYREGVLPVKSGNKWSLADEAGRILFPYRFAEIRSSHGGLLAARIRKQWGYIDASGEWVIEPRFKEVRDFSEGAAAVRSRQGWGFVDQRGDWIAKPRFAKVGNFENGGALVKKKFWGVIDAEGDYLLKPKFRNIERYPEGYCIRNQGKTTLYDLEGQILIP
ncbi:MAG: WG repeat-containing protein, partial [Bacteroidota bacterium]